MTQAPTPGPLSVGDYAVRLEDHPLVKAGEVHRVTEMFRGGYLGFARPVGGEWNPSGWRKCDADGWIPWSGGENLVPGQRVEIRCRDGIVKRDLSGIFSWSHSSSHDDRYSDIIAFRLAPTAPVEASGSEREDAWRDRALSAEASMDAIRRIEDAKAFGALSATDVACYRYPGEDQQALRGAFVDGVMSQSAWSVWLRGPDEVVAAKSYADAVEYCDRLNAEASLVRAVPMPVGVTLCPQPSGETREALDRLKMAAHVYEDDEMAADCATLEALLSARPLALGGQQGEEALDSGHGSVYDRLLTLIHDRDHALRGETSTDPNEIDETVREILRITTPSRAEAQSDAPYAGITEEERRSWPPEPWGGIPNAEWVESYERWHSRYGPAALARRVAKKARAEALDEGAAGELVAVNRDEWTPCSPEWLDAHPHDCGRAPRVAAKEWDGHSHYHPVNWPRSEHPVAWRFRDHPSGGWVYTGLGGRHDGCEVQPLYAHPSPTPAADADRVREAIALAEYVCGLLPSLAGAADQPDNKVYAAYANKREIMGARDRLATLKAQGK